MNKTDWTSNNNDRDVFSLEDIFSTIEKITGLEVSIYSSLQGAHCLKKLPIVYQRHMSSFCRIVKANKAEVGCGGHDAMQMTKKAGETGKPFVNVCHAGIAEAIFPVFGVKKSHIATIFIGQAVTEEVEAAGFRGVINRVRSLGVDETELNNAFESLPRISRKDLLNFGRLANMAVKGVVEEKGVEAFEQEVMLAGNPAIRRALDIIDESGAFSSLSETELARKVFLNPAYFSRLFKKIMKRNFSEYMTEKKIIFATSLLHTTDLSVMNISSACGYSKQSYFTRVFRAATGMTPSQYRSNAGGEATFKPT